MEKKPTSSLLPPELISILILQSIISFFTRILKLSTRFLSHSPRIHIEQASPNSYPTEVSKPEREISIREEAEMVMRKMGLIGEDEKLKEFMASEEIASMFEEKEPSLEEVKEAFSVFDENGDGFVDAGELQRVLVKLGFVREVGLDLCKKMIFLHDKNGDGRIDFGEFVMLMESSFSCLKTSETERKKPMKKKPTSSLLPPELISILILQSIISFFTRVLKLSKRFLSHSSRIHIEQASPYSYLLTFTQIWSSLTSATPSATSLMLFIFLFSVVCCVCIAGTLYVYKCYFSLWVECVRSISRFLFLWGCRLLGFILHLLEQKLYGFILHLVEQKLEQKLYGFIHHLLEQKLFGFIR